MLTDGKGKYCIGVAYGMANYQHSSKFQLRYTREPEAQLNPRKKQFEKIAPSLIVLPGEAPGSVTSRGCHHDARQWYKTTY